MPAQTHSAGTGTLNTLLQRCCSFAITLYVAVLQRLPCCSHTCFALLCLGVAGSSAALFKCRRVAMPAAVRPSYLGGLQWERQLHRLCHNVISVRTFRKDGHREECAALQACAPRSPPPTVRLAARVLWKRKRCAPVCAAADTGKSAVNTVRRFKLLHNSLT